MMLIDPPSPFDPLDEWKRFLDTMTALAVDHPDDEDVRAHIALAKETIKTLG